jgi:hypothetical protein
MDARVQGLAGVQREIWVAYVGVSAIGIVNKHGLHCWYTWPDLQPSHSLHPLFTHCRRPRVSLISSEHAFRARETPLSAAPRPDEALSTRSSNLTASPQITRDYHSTAEHPHSLHPAIPQHRAACVDPQASISPPRSWQTKSTRQSSWRASGSWASSGTRRTQSE